MDRLVPSEQVNLPAWKGQRGYFEIWFVVALDLDARRATWVRYTTFSPSRGDTPRAAVWVADYDLARDPVTLWARTVYPISEYDAATDRFCVRIGPDSEIRQGHCHGRVATPHQIAWSLDFAVGSAPVRRTPAVLEQMKLATQAVHTTAEAPVTGWIEVNGVRRELAHGKAVQMHLHGTRRVDELYWIWSPALAAQAASLEVISARMRRRLGKIVAPRLTSIWLRHGDELEDLTQLPDALRARVARPGPGLLDVSWTGTRRAIRVRAYAPTATFAGWAYRNPKGRDLHVAQSDVASCLVETFHRRHPLARWKPIARLASDRETALELHAPDPTPGIEYMGWEEQEPGPPTPHPAPTAPTPEPPGGAWEDLPAPHELFAAGLTYRAHAKETGADAGADTPPPVFKKDVSTWFPTGDAVVIPTSDALVAALERVEPSIAAELANRHGFVPTLLDYEVELGVVVLAAISRAELATGKLPWLGWFVANDLTARAVQILGEGQSDPMPYWSAAKGFPGFLPVTPRCWVPDRPQDRLPPVQLATRVNGVVRQDCAAADMMYRPSQLLAAAASVAGRDLVRGDVILTGTPPGVALKVPRWKRRLAELVLDRFGKLEAAIDMYVGGAGFLRPGDVVEIDGGFLGRRAVTIAIER